MIISVTSLDGPRLEFPPGHVIYQQKAGWFGHPRFSPDGSMIAFENHFIAGNDDGQVELLDMNGKHSVLFKSSSVEGLAWSPDGRELWFAARGRTSPLGEPRPGHIFVETKRGCDGAHGASVTCESRVAVTAITSISP